VARVALSCSVKEASAGVGIPRNNVQSPARISVAHNGFHALMKEMRNVHHLGVREFRLMSATFSNRRPDSVSETIAQNDNGANQVGTVSGAFGGAPMAVDAVLGVDKASTICGSIVYPLPFGWPALYGEQRGKQEGFSGDDHDHRARRQRRAPAPEVVVVRPWV
jgi:hypothetical protein